jgi:hypothetical protein
MDEAKTAEDDTLRFSVMKLRPFTNEELKTFGIGLWPTKAVTASEVLKMFPNPTKCR